MTADLTYAALGSLLEALLGSFDVRPLGEAYELAGACPVAVVRHDIDVSPRLALPVAQLEADLGIRATYLPMAGSRMYSLEGIAPTLRELSALGHEIGAHLEAFPGNLDAVVEEACAKVSRVSGDEVHSVSFHWPVRSLMYGPDRVAGRVNAYSARLMRWYLSDSRGTWGDGDPSAALRSPRGPLLQVLVHPVWWGECHGEPAERLQSFFEEETAGIPAEEAAALDEALRLAVTDVLRSGAA